MRILWALTGGRRSVNELADAVGRPAGTVSQHLTKLRMTRLVQTRREGTQIHYSLESEHVARLVTDALHDAEHRGSGIPPHHRGEAAQSLRTEGTDG